MLIAIFDTPATLHAEERLMPGRSADEVLACVRRVAVCEADLHFLTDKPLRFSYRLAMGHELSGIAEWALQGSRLVAGLPCSESDGHSSITGGFMAGHNHSGGKKFLPLQISGVM